MFDGNNLPAKRGKIPSFAPKNLCISLQDHLKDMTLDESPASCLLGGFSLFRGR